MQLTKHKINKKCGDSPKWKMAKDTGRTYKWCHVFGHRPKPWKVLGDDGDGWCVDYKPVMLYELNFGSYKPSEP
jgi:hypothetical protein